MTKKMLQKKGLITIPFLNVCLALYLLLFINTAVLGQSNMDDSNWDNTFSRPERSVAVAVKGLDYAVFAGVFRIPHSPVIGGNDENRFLLSIWDKDHWVLTGQVKQILDYSGSAYITDFDD
ncbi:MAG: hypothetical protein WB779_02910, partial [Ignavibacteriaceae bacterium]